MKNNKKLYHRNSIPNDKPWEKWAELWWKWCYSKPFDSNPVSDKTGKFCCKNQIYPETWFLAGTFGGEVRRVCEIPSKRSIFFPIVNDLINFAEYPQLKTEDNLLKYARRDLDTTTVLKVSIDGIRIDQLNDYRVRSEIFEIDLPMSKPSGRVIKTKAVTDGYWLFLKPLSPGEHTLKFQGVKRAFDEPKLVALKSKFTVKVEYHLNVAS